MPRKKKEEEKKKEKRKKGKREPPTVPRDGLNSLKDGKVRFSRGKEKKKRKRKRDDGTRPELPEQVLKGGLVSGRSPEETGRREEEKRRKGRGRALVSVIDS